LPLYRAPLPAYPVFPKLIAYPRALIQFLSVSPTLYLPPRRFEEPTARSTKSARPTLHTPRPGRQRQTETNDQVSPTYPAHLARHPYSVPSSGTSIGEIEAKDGLPSADRNNKATLLLTGPFRTAKSSAKDLTPLVLKLQYANYRDALRAPRRYRLLRR